MTISIQPVTTIEECRIIERLQAEIWRCDDIEVTPDHVVLTLAKEGSIALLALDEDKTPVGFAFGFLGFTANNRLKFASHQLGVLPAYQSRNIGYQLKLAQREAALARNLDLITWTFDPLQSRNAYFNLGKLGAVCHTYLPNLYGDMRDALNQGLPSDRFKVEWWIATDEVTDRIEGRFAEQALALAQWPIVNSAIPLENGLLAPADTFDDPHHSFCLVEIPPDINHLKTRMPDLALKWRRQTREIFEMAFAADYTAIDFLRREGHNYYLLQRAWRVER
jgi:predicted GNAT superfamily acetyltransferase